MTKEWRLFAEHILEGIERIRDYRSRVDAGHADQDMAADAIYRLLETICEAASEKLPEVVKEQHSEINWRAISGMRIWLAHRYLSIDSRVIEATINDDLEPLYQAMKIEVPNWRGRKKGDR
jgi:uncharacterized protein with HEPN domain